jgi:hypothetical protein
MAKLYWRVKRDGKWTWRPAKVLFMSDGVKRIVTELYVEEEE